MKDVQTLVGTLVQNVASGTQNQLADKPKEPFSASTLKMVILTFTRMADLFGSKASNRGFIIYQDENKGIFSEALLLWCRKLNDLTQEDFKIGFEGLEKRSEDAYRNGDEMWPPSYAEFMALCFPKIDRDTRAHKPFDRTLSLEDKTEKERRYQEGMKRTQELLQMLAPTEEIKPEQTAKDLEDLKRLEKIKNQGN